MPRDPEDYPIKAASNTQPVLLPVYVRCEGQNDNIGDVVLRRRLLDEFRKSGSLRIFIGKSTVEFVEGLRLGDGDAIFSDYGVWRSSLRQCAASQPTVYVDNPGELQVNWRVALSGLRLLPLMRAIRANGGCVFRLGVGARSRPGLYRPLFRIGALFHQLVYWRDPVSRDSFGFGSIMPDWGFADRGPDGPGVGPNPAADRNLLAVSLRDDRPYPSAAWFEALRAYSDRAVLRPIVVIQVRRDRERGRQLANDLGAEFCDWLDESLIARERKVRQVYSGCRMAISDRLHVLVLAVTEGAIPLCLTDYRESKVGRHFESIDYAGCSADTRGLRPDAISAILSQAEARGPEVAKCGAYALAEIARISDKARRLMAQIQ